MNVTTVLIATTAIALTLGGGLVGADVGTDVSDSSGEYEVEVEDVAEIDELDEDTHPDEVIEELFQEGSVETEEFEIEFHGTDGTASIYSNEIDEDVERSTNAASCVIGLDEDSTPLDIEVNPSNSTVTISPETPGEVDLDRTSGEVNPNGINQNGVQTLVDNCKE